MWTLLPLLKKVKLEKGDTLYWIDDHADDSKITFSQSLY